MFSDINKKNFIIENDLNNILKKLYDTNFFEDVSVSFENNVLKITVKNYLLFKR